MPRTKKEQVVFNGTGRRKSSIARVRLMSGKGNITVNGKPLDEYFGEETLKVIVRQPLTATNTLDKFDVIATVKGGGFSGQAGAVRHGIARALNAANLEYRPVLKSNGFLTRDPRKKERKKYGLKKARKSPRDNILYIQNPEVLTLPSFLFYIWYYCRFSISIHIVI